MEVRGKETPGQKMTKIYSKERGENNYEEYHI